jgi:hypothetical protein
MRGDDQDLAERLERGRQRVDSLGMHPIIIGHKDSRHRNCSLY